MLNLDLNWDGEWRAVRGVELQFRHGPARVEYWGQ
jgi:hypothetical protein